ncbi:MAG: hypothetical protein AB7D57_09045, partial [Desulfovibrionaceae bacterium]
MSTPDLTADHQDAIRRAARRCAARFDPAAPTALPAPLREHLLVGDCGKVHLLEAAALGLRALSAEGTGSAPGPEADLARSCVGAL